jgi:hypothetical protein
MVAAYAKFQSGRDFLRPEKDAACVRVVEREHERVLLRALFALPHTVTGTTLRQTRARSGGRCHNAVWNCLRRWVSRPYLCW